MRRRVSLVLAGLVFALLTCTLTRAMAVPTTVTVVMAPTQGGRIQLTLKTMMYEALGKGLRKD